MARYVRVALSVAGSAILLFSCEQTPAGDDTTNQEAIMTEFSENLSIVESRNGNRSYHFTSPLVEGYSLAREPYREFRKGVKITTYVDDSLSTVDAVLTANYAIYYEKRKLWEAKGNVVVEKADGKTLYTQQLFWNERTGKIYSNVDSKIVQNEGRDVFIGEGFESDEEFHDWRFRRMKGRMEVEVKPTEGRDSTALSPAAGAEEQARPMPGGESRPLRPGEMPPAPSRPVPSDASSSAGRRRGPVRRSDRVSAPVATPPSLSAPAAAETSASVETTRRADLQLSPERQLLAPDMHALPGEQPEPNISR